MMVCCRIGCEKREGRDSGSHQATDGIAATIGSYHSVGPVGTVEIGSRPHRQHAIENLWILLQTRFVMAS